MLHCADEDVACGWTQRLRCRSQQWYRLEALVTADGQGSRPDAGATLWVRPVGNESVVAERIRLAGVLRSARAMTLRGYFRTPPNVSAIDVSIGLQWVRGLVTVYSVFVTPNLDPDTESHPLSLPPPWHTYAAPRSVTRVGLDDQVADDGPLASLLRERFGRRLVRVNARHDDVRRGDGEALLLVGEKPPRGLNSLRALERFAADHWVIISLPAFAGIVGPTLQLRSVEQPDDPLCARIECAHFITRGFALHDVFPLSGPASGPQAFRQRQFLPCSRLTRLLRGDGYQTILTSVTDRDASSGRPICLYKPLGSHGVMVFDADALDAPPSTQDEASLAGYLLLNMLGADQATFGQFAHPAPSREAWDTFLREFVNRFEMFRLTRTSDDHLLLHLGHEHPSFGLSARRSPRLLIRTGLRDGDFAGMYGTLSYLKHLIRPAPHECPYLRDLAGSFRLSWAPQVAAWQGCEPTAPPLTAPVAPRTRQTDLDLTAVDGEDGPLAAVIDVTDAPRQRFRIVFSRSDNAFVRASTLLPQLAAHFIGEGHFGRAPADDAPRTDHDLRSWRFERLSPHVVVDPAAFATPFHRRAAAAGATLVRIEIPGSADDFTAHSIGRTGRVAATLEHVIGLQFGLLATNRTASTIAWDGHRSLRPGEALMLPADSAPGAAIRAG